MVPTSIGPQPKGRRHDPHEFVGVAGAKDTPDAQLSNLGIRNGDMNHAVPIHLLGRVSEWRFLELYSPTLPCHDASQFRSVYAQRMISRDDQSLPRSQNLRALRRHLVIPGDGRDADPSFDQSDRQILDVIVA